jgi:large exoprotein involved in heme utilization and adhesion
MTSPKRRVTLAAAFAGTLLLSAACATGSGTTNPAPGTATPSLPPKTVATAAPKAAPTPAPVATPTPATKTP